jgi:hypothetical protein
MGKLDRRALMKLLAAIIPSSYLPLTVNHDADIPDDYDDDDYDDDGYYDEDQPSPAEVGWGDGSFSRGTVTLFHDVIDRLLKGEDIANCASILVGEHPRTIEGMLLREFTKLSKPISTPLHREGTSYYADNICWPEKPSEARPVAGMLMYLRSDRRHPAICFVSCGYSGDWPNRELCSLDVIWNESGVFTVGM